MWKIIALVITVSLYGQDPALARLKHEMAVAREQESRREERGASRIAAVQAALRDWLEPQLPKDRYSLAGESSRLAVSLPVVLMDAGLSKPHAPDTYPELDDPGFDEVGLELKMMPELPDLLLVTATVKVPCGEDQAVYGYHFDGNGRTRVIDDHPEGYQGVKLDLSDPDSQGRRLLVVHRISTQCASSWMGMTYAAFRMSSSQPPEFLLSSKHGFWLGNEDGPIFVLKPNELTIEFLDSSVDTTVHNRTHIFRYNFTEGAKRLEPVALQPQDFAEEWLTRPWGEMQSLSAPAAQKWHSRLHADFVLGDYSKVALCADKPDRWSIGLEIDYIGEKKLEEPIEVHLLVRDLGNYRFEMEEVSDSEFEGCPGEGSPSDKHPWLSAEQLKALP